VLQGQRRTATYHLLHIQTDSIERAGRPQALCLCSCTRAAAKAQRLARLTLDCSTLPLLPACPALQAMAPAVTPTSSAHSHPIPAMGVKRPRKGTAQPSTSILPPPSGSISSVGPKDIVNGKQRQQAQEDEGNVYSATPPTKPTKKLSTGVTAGRRSRKDSSGSLTGRMKEEELDGLGSSSSSSNGATAGGSKGSSAGRTAAQPVKSALAASARLLSGPPGGSAAPGVSAPMASDRYKRSMYTAFVDNAFLERDRVSPGRLNRHVCVSTERAAHQRSLPLHLPLPGLHKVLLGSGIPIQIFSSLSFESFWYTFSLTMAASTIASRLEARYGFSFSACREHLGSPLGRHH
jgi:hypothetical protein